MGFDVKPLSRGKDKDIEFIDGGGFKVNYGGNGLLQYHPEKGSRHGGEYYKLSDSINGVRRFDKNGNKI